MQQYKKELQVSKMVDEPLKRQETLVDKISLIYEYDISDESEDESEDEDEVEDEVEDEEQEKETSAKKKSNSFTFSRSKGKVAKPDPEEYKSRIFEIKYQKKLSSRAKILLTSFKGKYLYYAIDDILYIFKSNLFERNNLLRLLYSPAVSLQNSFCVDFFDIWISEIYINEVKTNNKFLETTCINSEITIEFFYQIKTPVKKQESRW